MEITLPQWHKDVGYNVHFLALFLIPNELFWVSFICFDVHEFYICPWWKISAYVNTEDEKMLLSNQGSTKLKLC